MRQNNIEQQTHLLNSRKSVGKRRNSKNASHNDRKSIFRKQKPIRLVESVYLYDIYLFIHVKNDTPIENEIVCRSFSTNNDEFRFENLSKIDFNVVFD
jgi:hypothetical protein